MKTKADDPTQDALDVVINLEKICTDVSKAKNTETSPTTSLILRKQIIQSLVQLRLLHWDSYSALNHVKEVTQVAKRGADAVLLDIQNTRYQHRHLRQQIDQCLQYKCTVGDVDLSPIDEFLEHHSDFIDKNNEKPDTDDEMEVDDTGLDKYTQSDFELTVARLKDEEQKRLALFLEKRQLIEEKTRLSQDVKQLQEKVVDAKTLEQLLTKFIDDDTASLRQFFA